MKPWLSYGIKGMVICLLLFLFYGSIYYPLIKEYVAVDGAVPESYELLPAITGHFFPFMTHFIVEGSSLIPLFCKTTEKNCVQWTAKEFAREQGEECSTPWTLPDSETGKSLEGCCNQLIQTPSENCSERVETAVFFLMLFLLLSMYFALGVLVWWLKEKKRHKKNY